MSAQTEAPVAAPPKEKAKPDTQRPRPPVQPPYAVILLNDNDHTFEYVIEILRRVCRHNMNEAERLTRVLHHTGKAAVWTGSKEVAELKRDQIRGYGPDFYAQQPVRFPLGVRIEPMPG